MLFKKKCYVCSRKSKDVRRYFDEAGRKIHVCRLCVEYAERRAYRRA